MRSARLAAVVLLLAGITAARVAVDRPDLAIAVYVLIPIVLAAFWFQLPGALVTAVAASLLYVSTESIFPSPELAGSALWVAWANRSALYLGVAVLVVQLLGRERQLATRIAEQQVQLDELESLRAVLTPPELPVLPHLELAASFAPADGLVAGDFFLISPGPQDSTTIVVGDVAGHGLPAARRASYVRASLATFAQFNSDPVQLLQFANAALAERSGEGSQFVTAICLNIGAPPAMQLSWACAGQDPPWSLDTAAQLQGGQAGVPLGLAPAIPAIEAGCSQLSPGSGVIVFTDGIIEARPAHRDLSKPLELFGEERVRHVIRSQRGAAPKQVLRALVAAVTQFVDGPLADDVCIVACRATPSP
ncbi:MAG: PP2C family protein-serine/threonine phosphatase [Pseudonocardiaceae bacterium]